MDGRRGDSSGPVLPIGPLDGAGPEFGRALSQPNSLPAIEADATKGAPAIPHHRVCQPRRPPRWVRVAPRRDIGIRPRPVREGWRDPRIATAPGGGQVRTNFTYRNGFMTSADFSPTIGRDVYAEGPYEGIYRAILTTDHETSDFQFQIGTLTWITEDGETRRYTADGARITDSGRELWFEIKAHWSYFADPDVKATLDLAELALAAHDIGLERIDGSKLLNPIRQRTVGEVLRHRNAPFDRRDVDRVLALVERSGGVAPLGRVREALHPRRFQAEAMASAMLIRRLIGFPVVLPPTADTPRPRFPPPQPAPHPIRGLTCRFPSRSPWATCCCIATASGCASRGI